MHLMILPFFSCGSAYMGLHCQITSSLASRIEIFDTAILNPEVEIMNPVPRFARAILNLKSFVGNSQLPTNRK